MCAKLLSSSANRHGADAGNAVVNETVRRFDVTLRCLCAERESGLECLAVAAGVRNFTASRRSDASVVLRTEGVRRSAKRCETLSGNAIVIRAPEHWQIAARSLVAEEIWRLQSEAVAAGVGGRAASRRNDASVVPWTQCCRSNAVRHETALSYAVVLRAVEGHGVTGVRLLTDRPSENGAQTVTAGIGAGAAAERGHTGVCGRTESCRSDAFGHQTCLCNAVILRAI